MVPGRATNVLSRHLGVDPMKRTPSIATLLTCAMLAIAGCNRSSETSYSTSEYERDNDSYAVERSETKHSRTSSKSSSKEFKQDASSRSMAFPTGEQSTGVLLVTKQM